MTTKFLVMGIKEGSLVTSAWLASDGVKTEKEAGIVLGSWQVLCDTYQEALGAAEDVADNYPDGVTILPVMFKDKGGKK